MADSGVVKSLLQLLENLNNGIDSLEAASSLGVDHQAIVGAVKSLQANGNVSFYRLHISERYLVSIMADAMYSAKFALNSFHLPKGNFVAKLF